MKTTLRPGVSFFAFLLLLVSIHNFGTGNILPQKVKKDSCSGSYYIIPDSARINLFESKNFHFNGISKPAPGFAKQISAGLNSPIFNSWKFNKGYSHIDFSRIVVYIFDAADIIYPFHDFL